MYEIQHQRDNIIYLTKKKNKSLPHDLMIKINYNEETYCVYYGIYDAKKKKMLTMDGVYMIRTYQWYEEKKLIDVIFSCIYWKVNKK
jgi:hypothetical protein